MPVRPATGTGRPSDGTSTTTDPVSVLTFAATGRVPPAGTSKRIARPSTGRGASNVIRHEARATSRAASERQLVVSSWSTAANGRWERWEPPRAPASDALDEAPTDCAPTTRATVSWAAAPGIR